MHARDDLRVPACCDLRGTRILIGGVNRGKCTLNVRHYGKERAYRGLSLETPELRSLPSVVGDIVRVGRLGGLISEYRRIAA